MLTLQRTAYWASSIRSDVGATQRGAWGNGQARSEQWDSGQDHGDSFNVKESLAFSLQMGSSGDWALTADSRFAFFLEFMIAMTRSENRTVSEELEHDEFISREVVDKQHANGMDRTIVYRNEKSGELEATLDWDSIDLHYVSGRYDNIVFSSDTIRMIHGAIAHYTTAERTDWGPEPLEAEDIRQLSQIMPRRWRPLSGRLVFYREGKLISEESGDDAMVVTITAATVAPPHVQVVHLIRNTPDMPSADVFDLRMDWLNEWVAYWDHLREKGEHAADDGVPL